jgi:hypothetical protein
MSMETTLTLAFIGAVGFLVWAYVLIERQSKAIHALSSALAAVADGQATVYRNYSNQIIVTHKED